MLTISVPNRRPCRILLPQRYGRRRRIYHTGSLLSWLRHMETLIQILNFYISESSSLLLLIYSCVSRFITYVTNFLIIDCPFLSTSIHS